MRYNLIYLSAGLKMRHNLISECWPEDEIQPHISEFCPKDDLIRPKHVATIKY